MCIGNITRDAESRPVGQNQVARFGLAMSEKFKKQDGTIGENTEFINVELWGQVPVHQYLVKGQLVFIEGSIKTDNWTDNNGQQHRETKIHANIIQLLGSRPQQAAQAPRAAAPTGPVYAQAPVAPPPAPAYYQQPVQPAAPAPAPAPQPQYQQAPPAPQPPVAQASPTDDLPF